MLEPKGEMPPVIRIKTFNGELDHVINEWLESMRMKVKVLDIKFTGLKTAIVYQDFTGRESGKAVFSDDEKNKAFTS